MGEEQLTQAVLEELVQFSQNKLQARQLVPTRYFPVGQEQTPLTRVRLPVQTQLPPLRTKSVSQAKQVVSDEQLTHPWRLQARHWLLGRSR